MKKHFSGFITVLALVACPALQAQGLTDIYQLALHNDAELMVAEANYLAAVEALPLAESVTNPQVSLNAQASLGESDNSTSGNNSSRSYGVGVNLVKKLYDVEAVANISAAEAESAAQLALLEQTRQGLILRVATAFFQILAAQDNVEFAYAERTAIARQLEQAQKRFEVGLIAITDVHEAQARFDSAEAQVILTENLLDNANQALQVIIGELPSADLGQVADNLELSVPEPADAEAWVALARKHNQGLIAAVAKRHASFHQREARARNNYPQIDLTASYADSNLQDQRLADSRQDDFRIGVELNMPLFTGGRIDAERRQAEASYRAAQNSVLLQSRLVSQQARTAYLGVVSGISQVKALKQALESSNIALKATQAGFDVGTRTSVDVLVSLRETYGARRDFSGARYDYLVNTLKLRQAAGTINAADLGQIDRWLIRR